MKNQNPKVASRSRSLGARRRAISLLRAARSEFGPLSRPERKCIVAAATGEVADFSVDSPGYVSAIDQAVASIRIATNPDSHRDVRGHPNDIHGIASRWPIPKISVRADVVRWLLTCNDISSLISELGVMIIACRIEGELNCSNCDVQRPLILGMCIAGPVRLFHAKTRSIVLRKTLCLPDRVGIAFDADGLKVDGSIFLRDGFCALGETRLQGSVVSSSLDMVGGIFLGKYNAVSLAMDGIEVGGGVSLNQDFLAVGTVRMVSARIGDSLHCSGGKMFSRRDALVADRITTGGGVFLNEKFHSVGCVRFSGASIGGDFSCNDANFINRDGNAILLDGSSISGNLFFIDNFLAEGVVRMVATYVGGNLCLRGGSFMNSNGVAILATRAKIRNLLDIAGVKRIDGVFDISAASATFLGDSSQDSWSWPPKVCLSGFSYGSIAAKSTLDVDIRLKWLQNHDNTMGDTLPDPQPYQQLSVVLKNHGRHRDSRKILYVFECRYHKELQKLYNKQCWGIITALVFLRSVLYKGVVGYGFSRWRALWWLAGLVVVGAIIFSFQGGRRMQPVQMLALREFESAAAQPAAMDAGSDLARRYPKFNPVLYSMDALIPLVSFHQEEYWTPRVDPRAKGWHKFVSTSWWIKIYHTVHISLGWIIATLFAASFTRLMRSD